MSDGKKEIGVRLAIRKEGAWVNAYLALSDTMQGAIKIGSIMAPVASRPAIWEQWKGLMTEVMAIAVEECFGAWPEIKERPAPEHERSGEA